MKEMDTRRGDNAALDEERWLFVGKDQCCPPSLTAILRCVDGPVVLELEGPIASLALASGKVEPSTSDDDDQL